MRYLDPLALAKLKNYSLRLRRFRAEGHLSGRHRSIHHGFSQEFAQHREYSQGDELRYLDWKVYARKDRFVVKQFQEDKSLQTYILADCSGSMSLQGAGLVSKWDYACSMAAAIAFLVLAEGDAAGLVTFDTDLRSLLPPRRQITHLELIDTALAKTKPGGETDLSGVLLRTLSMIPRRSLIIIVSDLMGDAEKILQVIKALAARKHEVFVLQVLDPLERDLSIDGPVRFESLENDEWLRCEVSMIRAAYRREFERQLKLYDVGFHRAGIPYAVAYTDVPWDRALANFLALERVI